MYGNLRYLSKSFTLHLCIYLCLQVCVRAHVRVHVASFVAASVSVCMCQACFYAYSHFIQVAKVSSHLYANHSKLFCTWAVRQMYISFQQHKIKDTNWNFIIHFVMWYHSTWYVYKCVCACLCHNVCHKLIYHEPINFDWHQIENNHGDCNITVTYVIMSAIEFQITGVSIACSAVCWGAEQRKHQSSASLAFMGNPCTDGRWIPLTKASIAEDVSIWSCDYLWHKIQWDFNMDI